MSVLYLLEVKKEMFEITAVPASGITCYSRQKIMFVVINKYFTNYIRFRVVCVYLQFRYDALLSFYLLLKKRTSYHLHF